MTAEVINIIHSERYVLAYIAYGSCRQRNIGTFEVTASLGVVWSHSPHLSLS